MKKQIFSKAFTVFLVISFLFLNASGIFVNQAQALDPTGTIIVNKFNDENADGVWDDDEMLIVDWPVFISLEGSKDIIEPDSEPDSATNGSVFNNVPVGSYYICEETKDGWENTKPGKEAHSWGDDKMAVCYGPEALTEGQTIEVSFGNHLIEEEIVEEEEEAVEEEEEEIPETTTTTAVADTEQTTTTTVAVQVTTTVAESALEEDELVEEDLEEIEEDKEEPYDWTWVLIVALLIVGGALLFSKK